MNLIQQFAALIQSGVTVHIKLSRFGNEVQMDILPIAAGNATGISLPPKALLGTAQELDEALPGFLQTYLHSSSNIQQQIEQATSELKAAEEAAKEQAQAVVKAKQADKSKVTTSKTLTSSPKKTRDMSAGLMGEDDKNDDDQAGDASVGESNETDKPQVAASTAGSGVPAVQEDALSADLF